MRTDPSRSTECVDMPSVSIQLSVRLWYMRSLLQAVRADAERRMASELAGPVAWPVVWRVSTPAGPPLSCMGVHRMPVAWHAMLQAQPGAPPVRDAGCHHQAAQAAINGAAKLEGRRRRWQGRGPVDHSARGVRPAPFCAPARHPSTMRPPTQPPLIGAPTHFHPQLPVEAKAANGLVPRQAPQAHAEASKRLRVAAALLRAASAPEPLPALLHLEEGIRIRRGQCTILCYCTVQYGG